MWQQNCTRGQGFVFRWQKHNLPFHFSEDFSFCCFLLFSLVPDSNLEMAFKAPPPHNSLYFGTSLYKIIADHQLFPALVPLSENLADFLRDGRLDFTNVPHLIFQRSGAQAGSVWSWLKVQCYVTLHYYCLYMYPSIGPSIQPSY